MITEAELARSLAHSMATRRTDVVSWRAVDADTPGEQLRAATTGHRNGFVIELLDGSVFHVVVTAVAARPAVPAVGSRVKVRFPTVRSSITRIVTVTGNDPEAGEFWGTYTIHGCTMESSRLPLDSLVVT